LDRRLHHWRGNVGRECLDHLLIVGVSSREMTQPRPSDGAGHDEHASLVPLLLAMTVVTGIVDAVSILRLGHVFVANMTGNVAFLGFALAGASGFSVLASLVALAAFLAGAAIGARMPRSTPQRLLSRIAAAEAVLCAAATVVAATRSGTAARYTITVVLAVALGGQNATARKLAVPDMTTTVLTLTLTGLVADTPDLRKPGSHTRRRAAAVAAVLVGATSGAFLVVNTSTGWALGAVTAIVAAVAVAARRQAPPTAPPAAG
jgi:uncharacterized membrane protein YoaK (UPF0700 family)